MQETILSQDYLSSLNPAQLEAVKNLEGPQLVLAGAGTGKTKVLTTRIAHLIIERKAYPSQILAVTFTNKAAKEMHQRVMSLVNSEGIWLGTFHSIAAKILRRYAHFVGLNSNYNILDTDDQIRLIKTILTALNLDDKKYPAKMVANNIARWKDLGLCYHQVKTQDIKNETMEICLKLYKEYHNYLLSIGAVDFGDLLLYNIKLFTEHAEILAFYHNKFKYMLVDEYQDTNIAQYIWLRMLAQKDKNICCVGDEDQSIYGFRGAEIANILRFEQDFPLAKITRLEQNYRSTNHILNVATKVIANNKMRLGKSLWTDFSGGGKVKLVPCDDDRAEARFIASEIFSLQRNQEISLKDMAILVRAGFQTRAFEECFISYAINYKVIGGLRFYERLEVKDAIAYIRVAIKPDDDLALERIINVPKKSIGEVTISQIRQYAKEHRLSLFKAIMAKINNNEFKPKIHLALTKTIEQFKRWHQLFDIEDHVRVVEIILEESGYLAMWRSDKSQDAETRIENIRELLKALGEFQNVSEFLQHIILVTDIDDKDTNNMINIMTLHAAKGLEFNTVFLPGWEEGIFPHQRSLDANDHSSLEEERRLAYVGITRAKSNLYISHVSYRRIYNQIQTQIASRFTKELPEENIAIIKWE